MYVYVYVVCVMYLNVCKKWRNCGWRWDNKKAIPYLINFQAIYLIITKSKIKHYQIDANLTKNIFFKTYNIFRDVRKGRIMFQVQQLISKLSSYTNKWLQTGINHINYLKPQILFSIELINYL